MPLFLLRCQRNGTGPTEFCLPRCVKPCVVDGSNNGDRPGPFNSISTAKSSLAIRCSLLPRQNSDTDVSSVLHRRISTNHFKLVSIDRVYNPQSFRPCLNIGQTLRLAFRLGSDPTRYSNVREIWAPQTALSGWLTQECSVECVYYRHYEQEQRDRLAVADPPGH